MAKAKQRAKRPAYCVQSSPVHGKGLFAARVIGNDRLIGIFEAEPARRDGTYVLWLIDDDGTQQGWRGTNELRFLNHSKRANAALYERELWSLRRIEKGEEIFIDYGWDE